MLLAHERTLLETHAPGLDKTLAEVGLERLEDPALKLLPKLIKEARLPGLLVPQALGGAGCSPYDAIRVQRAVAARSPSMGIMMTMHNFTISFCNLLAEAAPAVGEMLQGVAKQHLLVASGFAEGRFGSGILDSTLSLTAAPGGYRLNGAKKPCTMSHCMDILTAGVSHVGPDGVKRTGMAILPANQPGMSAHAFWKAPVLAAADSHELRLENVFVSEEQVLIASAESEEEQAMIAVSEAMGLCWFEIIATANYLGVVSGLAEKALGNKNLDAPEISALACELETAQAALDGAVRLMETGPFDESLLPRVLRIRFAVQGTIERCAMRAAELAGGLAFVQGPAVGILLAASRCLAFHPISRKAAEPMIAGHYAGRAIA
jgi:alkylation response protein AidB-like acyl-CoA dehydrogenase